MNEFNVKFFREQGIVIVVVQCIIFFGNSGGSCVKGDGVGDWDGFGVSFGVCYFIFEVLVIEKVEYYK